MSDRPAPAHRGVVAGQVAEIIVTLDGEAGRRGSGYRVGPTAVLTAAHVIEGAVSVRVRFDADLPGEWTTEAISYWTDLRSDLAMLTIAPHQGESPVTVARFGRISDRAAVLAAQAVGFPQFKLKTDDGEEPVYRDSHQAVGSVAVLSNRREGTLEVTVPPPERDPDPATSPWEGMSGAAVWVGDRIVGVIAKHHRSDGLGRLAAVRLDLALESLDPDRRANLRTLLSLPDVLPDVVQPSTGERMTTAYQAGSQHAVRSHRQAILFRLTIGILLVGVVVAAVLTIFWGSGPRASSDEATAAAIQDVLCMQDGISASWQNHHSKLYLAVRDNATGADATALDESPLPETTFTVRRSKLQDFPVCAHELVTQRHASRPLCLGLEDPGRTGSGVILTECSGQPAQQWVIENHWPHEGVMWRRLRPARHPDSCLQQQSDKESSDVRAVVQKCGTNWVQQWDLQSDSDTYQHNPGSPAKSAPKSSCSGALQVPLVRYDGSRDGAPIVNVRTCIQRPKDGYSAIIEAASESGSLRSVLVSWRIELHSCRTGYGIIARDYVPPDDYSDASSISKATISYRDPKKPDMYYSNGRILWITVVDASGEQWRAGQMDNVESSCSD